MAALETSALSLGAQEEALRDQIAGLKRSLTGLSRDELEYTRLASEVESNRRLHAMLSERLSAARIREQGEMKVVKVIDPPSVPVPAVNQKRIRFLGVALAFALVIGLGIPAAVEYFNRPIESDEDVRSLTGLPVLASIPRVRSRRSMFMVGGGQPDDVSRRNYSSSWRPSGACGWRSASWARHSDAPDHDCQRLAGARASRRWW
jgi:hypothetical protein